MSNLTPEIQRIRDAQLARLRANPDGSTVPRDPARQVAGDLAVTATPLVSGLSGYLDDYTAVQLGLVQLLQGLTFRVTDLTALMDGRLETRAMDFGGRIFLDYPDPEDERIPVPSATVQEAAPPEYTLPGPISPAGYVEGSEGVWGEGTILRSAYFGSYPLQVVCWLSKKDDRAAVRQGLVACFYAEPRDERSDRRISLPWYFDQVARYTLTSISYPDTDEQATRGVWPLVAAIQATVTAVHLVPAPGYLREPQISVNAG